MFPARVLRWTETVSSGRIVVAIVLAIDQTLLREVTITVAAVTAVAISTVTVSTVAVSAITVVAPRAPASIVAAPATIVAAVVVTPVVIAVVSAVAAAVSRVVTFAVSLRVVIMAPGARALLRTLLQAPPPILVPLLIGLVPRVSAIATVVFAAVVSTAVVVTAVLGVRGDGHQSSQP